MLARLLRINCVSRYVGLSRSTIYRKVSEGSFPAPLKITEGCVAWRIEDLDNWIASLSRSDHISADVSEVDSGVMHDEP